MPKRASREQHTRRLSWTNFDSGRVWADDTTARRRDGSLPEAGACSLLLKISSKQKSDRTPSSLLLRASSIGLIASVTPLDPPGGAEVDGSVQPARARPGVERQ